MALDPRIARLLKKKYKKKFGVKVGDATQMRKALGSGAKISTYAKDGGYIAKKGKKIVKKRKTTKKK
jgi:hypothetical protein|tara:strand:+ start:185 stop:385 length:201 start_codon:yes stop_codon:yes gene_type:complete